MASEMPVLPLVGSSTVCPGSSSPSRSAASISDSATRSLTEPVGLACSSFAHSRAPPSGRRRGSSTSGVLPIAERTSGLVPRAASAIGFTGRRPPSPG
jgi:hypothetical protein